MYASDSVSNCGEPSFVSNIDRFETLEAVSKAIKQEGVESCGLIFGMANHIWRSYFLIYWYTDCCSIHCQVFSDLKWNKWRSPLSVSNQLSLVNCIVRQNIIPFNWLKYQCLRVGFQPIKRATRIKKKYALFKFSFFPLFSHTCTTLKTRKNI